MNQINNDSKIKTMLETLLSKYKNQLNQNTIEAVKHYIQHDEYEMAYEGLFIDLMSINFSIQNIDILSYTQLGIILKLDSESVFKISFWEDFIEYIDRNM